MHSAAGKLAIVFGDGFLITRRYLRRVRVANRPTARFVQLPPQLQFERVYFADQLLVHLLHQRRVAWEPARIELAHLIDQRLQLLLRFGTILHRAFHLVQQIQTLFDLTLARPPDWNRAAAQRP